MWTWKLFLKCSNGSINQNSLGLQRILPPAPRIQQCGKVVQEYLTQKRRFSECKTLYTTVHIYHLEAAIWWYHKLHLSADRSWVPRNTGNLSVSDFICSWWLHKPSVNQMSRNYQYPHRRQVVTRFGLKENWCWIYFPTVVLYQRNSFSKDLLWIRNFTQVLRFLQWHNRRFWSYGMWCCVIGCFPTFQRYVLPSVLMGKHINKHIKRKQRERNEVIYVSSSWLPDLKWNV